jgi:hypothetical protein
VRKSIIAIALLTTLLMPTGVATANPIVTRIAQELRTTGHKIPAKLVQGCNRSLRKEHYDCRGGGKCAARGKKSCVYKIQARRNYVGLLQYGWKWNKTRRGCQNADGSVWLYPCSTPMFDWRLCPEHAIYTYLHYGAHSGLKKLHGQWPTAW